MSNQEYISALPAEEFYAAIKQAERDGRAWTDTYQYVINWLKEEHVESIPREVVKLNSGSSFCF